MELTQKQEEGLKLAVSRYLSHQPMTVIGGFAGTGKSTLVKFIIEALADYGVDPEADVCYTSYTGKATQVLLQKGNQNVSTLHKLLYKSVPKKEGGYYRKLVPVGDIEYKVIVVDEVSMVPKTMMEQLLNHGIYVLALGDPFQLPQIDKDEDHGLLLHPHVFLDEVMRQAKESEIIQVSMKIRNFEPIEKMKGNEVQIFDLPELNHGMLLWADQVICATNATRASLNQQMRELKGFSGNPQVGEKVICVKNDWDTIDSGGNALVNGTVGIIQDIEQKTCWIPSWTRPNVPKIEISNCILKTELDTSFNHIKADTKMFETEEPTLDWSTSFKLNKKVDTKCLVPQSFAFGYAITAHKSQGSQWNNVLVVEEWYPKDKVEHARWLYTACTRAAERLVLVR